MPMLALGLPVVAAQTATNAFGWPQSHLIFCCAPDDVRVKQLKSRLEEVRREFNGEHEPHVQQEDGAHTVKFWAKEDANMFQVLTCLLSGAAGFDLSNFPDDDDKEAEREKVFVDYSTVSMSMLVRRDNFKVYVFCPFFGPFNASVTIECYDRFFNDREIDSIAEAYELAGGGCQGPLREVPLENEAEGGAVKGVPPATPHQSLPQDEESFRRAKEDLQAYGISVFRAKEPLDWEDLAGYESVKQKLDDTLTYSLSHPEVYDRIARGTRKRFQTSRPRAVLFEGPPGCGKTSTGKILASQAGVPFVHVPLEAVVSKWYGDSERMMAGVLKAASELGFALIFLDEVDALGASRDNGIHEASRKMLSVLLRHLDGLEGQHKSIIIAATNRKSDLDAALLSRFDVIIRFDLPDQGTRAKVFRLYAKHLSDDDIGKLAARSDGMSGRAILDVCKEAERRCAGRAIRSKAKSADFLPTIDDYFTVLDARAELEREQTTR